MKRIKGVKPLVAITLLGLAATPDPRRTAQEDRRNQVGFPFEIVSEELLRIPGAPLRRAFVRLPKSYYSRDNLDRLFTFYVLQHPEIHERLHVYVTVGEQRSDRADDALASQKKELSLGEDLGRWDALFNREGDGAAALGGRNEWYAYNPNLDNREEKRIVILKCSLLTRSKRILQTWETSQAGARIRVLAYQLPGVEPPGVYYTFQSFSAEWSEWHSILTFRQDHFVPIPEDSVTFINDSVAYVFMGCMFAVATDGGKNWRAWDAERDYENSSLSDHYLIEHVEIDSSGDGTMTLMCVSQSPGLRTLSTKDFGQHWN